MAIDVVDVEEGIKEEKLIEVTNGLVAKGLALLDQRFSPNSENPQIFHVKKHSEDVLRRGQFLVSLVNKIMPGFVSLVQLQRLRTAAAFHDSIQDYSVENPGTIKEVRIRKRGPNEEGSGQEASSEMRNINEITGEEVFNNQDQSIVSKAVSNGTFVEWDGGLGTVVQTRVSKESSLEEKFMALIDIGGAGMDGAEQYILEGNAEFRELKIGITRVITQALSLEDGLSKISAEDREYISKEIRSWLADSQVRFVQGRQRRLETELGWFDNEQVEEGLRREGFTKFEESIKAAQERAEFAKTSTFHQLLTLIGYI